MNIEILNEVARNIPELSTQEFELGSPRASEQSVAAISAEIEDFRKQFTGNRNYMSQDEWKRCRAEAKAAATKELLSQSVDMRELTDLQKRAEEMRKEAEAKEAALNAAWIEFISIPERAERINEKLNSIANELASLDITKIEADFRHLYRATLNGAVADPFPQMQLAALLVTRELRKEVLNELAEALNGELADLKARSKVLAKKLGMRSPL
jgi:DNA repair exonuclease SbcCD ATPase subunit